MAQDYLFILKPNKKTVKKAFESKALKNLSPQRLKQPSTFYLGLERLIFVAHGCNAIVTRPMIM